jgi:DNA-directed RNA polymerase specialized sigma24 family protein
MLFGFCLGEVLKINSAMLTDIDLLRRYAQHGAEAAFGELVARHANLVYSTALRILNGDRHLACDVAQSVFTDLARKAMEDGSGFTHEWTVLS